MKLILIENKIYKVPKKVFEALQKLREEEQIDYKAGLVLDEYCDYIKNGDTYGVRYLGEVEFQKSEKIPF